MSVVEYVTNNFSSWTQGGQIAWEMVAGGSKAKNASPLTAVAYTSTIQKGFTLDRPADTASLTITGRKYVVDSPGDTVRAVVHLRDVDLTWNELYDQQYGTGMLTTWLDALDIASYLTKAGAYVLRVTVYVTSSPADDPPPWLVSSWVQVEDVSLQVVVPESNEIEFDENAGISEVFFSDLTFMELATAKEYHFTGETTPPVPQEERLLAGKSDGVVYFFDAGIPIATFDTDDEDFGHPGMDKTLDAVQFESSAVAAHTVQIYVSVDSGLTWDLVGSDTAQRGKACSVHLWVTAEKFRVRFTGAGLNLSSYKLLAIPRGRMPKQ